MTRIGLTALLKIELPSRTLLFADGGFIEYNSEIYRSRDAVFGTVGDITLTAETVGDSVPAINLRLLPPDTSAPIELSQPGNQTSPAKFIIVEYDADTGVATSGETFFNGQVDQSALSYGRGSLELSVSLVGLTERLFEQNIGNTLNPTWHKGVWPGETGHDNATGLGRPVAWGTENTGAATTTVVDGGKSKKKKNKS